METKICEYVRSLFADAPDTVRASELREEVSQNTIDKYHDLLAEGRDPESAYNAAIAGIGNMSELIDMLRHEDSADAEKTRQTAQKRSGFLLALGVALCILSVVPVMLLDVVPHGDTIGPALMFLFIALGVGCLVYNANTSKTYRKRDDTVVEDFKQWKADGKANRSRNPVEVAILSGVWGLGALTYGLLSLFTGAWAITWLIFPMLAFLCGMIRAIFDLRK